MQAPRGKQRRAATESLAGSLTEFSVRRPGVVVAVAILVLAVLAGPALNIPKEVGYASYFGPDDPRVLDLESYLDDYESGVHLVLVFGTRPGSPFEDALSETTLSIVGRLQARIDQIPNVRSTWSVLNGAILVGPLDTETLAEERDDGFDLRADWLDLAARLPQQRFLTGSVISRDQRTVGIVVELQSLQSEPMSEAVHGIQAILPPFERELGDEIYMAGDPVWTVFSSDSLSRDSTVLTVLMFVAMLLILRLLFADLNLMLLPVVSVGALVLSVQGIQGLIAIPMTSVLAALPPVLVVIAVTASIHLLSALVRNSGPKGSDRMDVALQQALLKGAREVGSGCFWAAATTTLGFASFLWSGLESFRHFGLLSAIGLALAFAVNFTLLPALLMLSCRITGWAPKSHRPGLPRTIVEMFYSGAARHTRIVLVVLTMVFVFLASGVLKLFYATDVGFGEQSYVIRSLRYIEANFRPPMKTEIEVVIPDGKRIYDRESLEVLAKIESALQQEPSTGAVWSFLDLLEEAFRIDRGRNAASWDELVDSARRSTAIVASMPNAASYWHEATVESDSAELAQRDRARISVDRAWLDETEQAPYIRRLREFAAGANREFAPAGYRVELRGGMILAQRFLEQLRETQWRSFSSAFGIVALTLLGLLWGSWRLAFWAVLANVLPIAALVGLMGWLGIGVDPANAMAAAILLSIAVDDTIHMALRFKRERADGASVRTAASATFETVGEAVVISSMCLAIGFSVLAFSQWGGLVSFGLLASLGVIFALLGDLLLLPSALIASEPERVVEPRHA